MKIEYENKHLTVYLSGEVTSENAEAIRSELIDFCKSHEAEDCCFDLCDLRYISSSGLRILISTAKTIKDVTIRNVSLEVYEILAITGITEIVPVTRSFTQMSVSGCPVIGRGKNATVYRYNQDTVVKVCTKDGATYEDVARELLLARDAFILGVPTALSLNVVKVGDRFGVVYEMVGAESMMDMVLAEPSRTEPIAEQFAESMAKINSIRVEENSTLPDKRVEYISWMNDLKAMLTDEENRKLTELIALIPKERRLIHGDYQPGNVMMQKGEVILIDMDTLGYGSTVLELSNTYSTLVTFRMLKTDNFPLSEKQRMIFWKKIEEKAFTSMNEKDRLNQLLLIQTLSYGRVWRYATRHTDICDEEDAQKLKTLFFLGMEKLGL